VMGLHQGVGVPCLLLSVEEGFRKTFREIRLDKSFCDKRDETHMQFAPFETYIIQLFVTGGVKCERVN